MAHQMLASLIAAAGCAVMVCARAGAQPANEAPPAPFGPTPSEAQQAWHELEFYGFIHFTVDTFTDREWGYGDEAPAVFNPGALDCRQWVAVAKAAGMKGLVLTAKHHDGFCLWPTATTAHSVKASPYKGGKGDVVGELAEACREAGLGLGVYCSPWDRNAAAYGTDAYVTMYHEQWRELLTGYGPLFEVWFDGANGGDGYYGGAREQRSIDPRTYYRFEALWGRVRELQPRACIFSDLGPDIRWVGNESGYAGEECWATYTPHGKKERDRPAPGDIASEEGLRGHRDGKYWLPAEVDVSIRPGWFYHPAEDEKVKTTGQLEEIYYNSVGRGASLILNMPPDRRGLIPATDEQRLRALGEILRRTFEKDLARGKAVSASNTRGPGERFRAGNAADGDRETYWCTDDGVRAGEATIDLGAPTEINVVSLREYLPLGQRVDSFEVQWFDGSAWKPLGKGTSIGSRRLLRTPTVAATRVRVRFMSAATCPAIAEIALYRRPE